MSNNARINANELNLRYAIPVGEFIKDEMSFRGVSQTEMALLMGIELPKFNKILNGTQRLTADVALKIEEVWGIPAHIYLDIQSQYEIDKEKLAEEEDFYKFSFEMIDNPDSIFCISDSISCLSILVTNIPDMLFIK